MATRSIAAARQRSWPAFLLMSRKTSFAHERLVFCKTEQKGRVMARSKLHLAILVACMVLVCGCATAYAEPLFFDCHGTLTHGLDPRYPDQKPEDTTMHVIVDPSRGEIEYGGGGSNRYCKQESDWVPQPHPGDMTKIIRWCTTLLTSEEAYSFYTTAELQMAQKLSDGRLALLIKTQVLGSGSLNRFTGEFIYTQSQSSQTTGPNESSPTTGSNRWTGSTWKLSCVPAQRKF
jgi:hypothetical protein